MTLPGYEAQRAMEMQWAFSSKKQSDFDTKVADGSITMTHPVREVNPAEVSKEFRSDKDTYGKGHEFATDIWQVAQDVRKTINVDGSSYMLGWLIAFALGKVVTTQPDVTNCPNTYQHACTFFDPDTEATAQLPVTTIVEKVTGAANLKRYLESMALSSLTISGEGFEHLNAVAEWIGGGKVTASALTMPDLPTVSYLTSNFATVKLGDTEEAVTTRVRSWSVAINNNPKEDRGYFPSSGMYRGRLEIGARTVVPSLVIDLDATSDFYDDFIANTQLALEILCEGDVAESAPCTTKHTLKLEFPRLKYTALPIEESDGVFTYAVTFSEESVLYNASDTPPLFQATVINKTVSYLTT